MRTTVIDLIIQMARHIRAGESLEQINPGNLKTATKAETAAAYSWIMQKAQAGRLQQAQDAAREQGDMTGELLQALHESIEARAAERNTTEIYPRPRRHRVLHAAERSVISTEAYGYLLELYNIGVLDEANLESLIESAMMSNHEKLNMETMREMVASLIFGRAPDGPNRMFLHGSETVN